MKHLILLAVIAAAGCSDPVNVEGSYTMSVTNRVNGCNLNNWMVDESFTGVHASIVQSGEGLTATFMDISRIYLDDLTGTHVMSGSVDGNDIAMSLIGTKNRTLGNCTYTYDARLTGTIEGDVLQGKVEYIGVGNGQPDCAGINGCVSYQDMNGTRPPT